MNLTVSYFNLLDLQKLFVLSKKLEILNLQEIAGKLRIRIL